MQNELDSTLQRTSAHAQSLQGALADIRKEREELQFALQQARSALESRVSEREYMQSEASSLQQALHKQTQETQQAQQACDTWMTNARQQVLITKETANATDLSPFQTVLLDLGMQLHRRWPMLQPMACILRSVCLTNNVSHAILLRGCGTECWSPNDDQ